VAINGILAIGRTKAHSHRGGPGSRFWIGQWDDSDIGLYFADCPSGVHDLLCLNYRRCGPAGGRRWRMPIRHWTAGSRSLPPALNPSFAGCGPKPCSALPGAMADEWPG